MHEKDYDNFSYQVTPPKIPEFLIDEYGFEDEARNGYLFEDRIFTSYDFQPSHCEKDGFIFLEWLSIKDKKVLIKFITFDNSDIGLISLDTAICFVPFEKRFTIRRGENCQHKTSISVTLEIQNNGDDLFVNLRSHFGYELEIQQEDSSHKIVLAANHGELRILPHAESDSIRLKHQSFRYGEPFNLESTYYAIDSVDIATSTAYCRIFPADYIPQGHKQGYYTDLDILYRTIKKNDPSLDISKNRWKDQEYYLLHFWGHWCPPCITELPRLNRTINKLKDDPVLVLNFPYIFPPSTKEELNEFMSTNKVPPYQIVQYGYGEDEVMDLLKVEAFPTHILIDKTGRIAYRGTNELNEIGMLLQDYLLD